MHDRGGTGAAAGARYERLRQLAAESGVDPRTLHLPDPFDERRCAASFMQRRLWFVEQFQGDISAYHIPVAVRLEGTLDRPALERAIGSVVERHETLRTSLVDELGVLVQNIAPCFACHLDTRQLPVTRDEDAVATFLAVSSGFVQQRFNFLAGPPWRAALFERNERDRFLLFVFHHTIFDGWSIDVLLRDLAGAYGDELRGRQPSADALQYAEFCAWQHARTTAGAFDADVDYWASTLAGAPEDIDIRGDIGASRGAGPVAGSLVREPLSPAVAKRLADVAAEAQATTFAVGLAAWTAWLWHYTDQPDLVIGTPSSGRSLTAFHNLIGPCINTLALRLDASAAPTFASLVQAARRTTVEARDHENAPIDRVLDRLRPGRIAGRTPFAQIAFTAPISRRAPEFDSLAATRVFPAIPGAKSDIALDISRRYSEWTIAVEYNAALFSERGARAALHDFVAFAEPLLQAPNQPLRAARRRGRSDAFALTSSQMRMWLEQERSPQSPVCNVSTAIEMHGGFDSDAFDRAFAGLVASHDAFRLTFSVHAGVPAQRVADVAVATRHIDLSAATDAERREWLRCEAAAPFDLNGPLIRSTVVHLGEREHLWVCVQHHLITDGWTSRLTAERLNDLYQRERRGESGTVSYPSFAAHLLATRRSHIPADSCDAAGAAWWESEFEGVEAPRLFGVRPDKRGTRVTRAAVPLDPRTRARLREIVDEAGRAADLSAFLATAPALVALIHRMTGDGRIGLGVPFHNRRTDEERAIAGPFMDVLPVAVGCSGDDTLASLATKIGVALRRSLRHAASPPPLSVRARGCDVLVNVQTTTMREFCGCDARVRWVHAGHERESLALQVHLDGAGGIGIDLDAHNDVFDDEARARFAERFERVLATAMDAPDTRVADIALVSEEERRSVAATARGRRVPRALAAPVLMDIAAQAAQAPEATAVECGGEAVSYAGLLSRVRSVTGALVAGGIRPGDVVGVCLPRSIDFVAAMLGVLGAGAAYLPLDPAAPAARRRACVEHAGASRVIARATIGATIAHEPCASFVAHDMDALAYVIYTSGSTGAPKGVEITHRGLANYTRYAVDAFGLSPSDRALQFAALTFDTAVEEIFPTLTAGGTLVLKDEEMVASAERFVAGLRQRRISVVNLPTSYWHTLAAAGARMPPGVRLVLVGGEAVQRDLLTRWQSTHRTRVRLLNGYGPTETTIVATFADLTLDTSDNPVPIGAPVWNADVHVVDACGAAAPIGHAGELLIGGAGLARGYRNDARATAERFIAHPLADGARLYRTGDRARRRADGTLEFLGRLDDQLKIRGYRVEPGEIEQRLRQHPAIADAAVVSCTTDGQSALAAYVVVRAAAAITASDARAHVRERLPEFMVPTGVFAVPVIPRTSSGKADRAQLASRAAALPERSADDAPATVLQERIAHVWNEVLQKQASGIRENFFDAGGHSLLATQLVARVSSGLGVRIPLRTVFEHPTIAGLAAAIEQQRDGVHTGPRPIAGDSVGPFPLSFAQERIWFAEQLMPGTRRFTMPTLLRMKGPLDAAALQQAVDALVERHASLRTTIVADSSGERQIVRPPAPAVIEQMDVSGSDNRDEAARYAADAFLARPFDLVAGPLFRVALIRAGADDHWLVQACHHIVFDGWSAHVVVEDLSELYAGAARGTNGATPRGAATYAEFVDWQRSQLDGAALETLLDYWRRELRGGPELRLAADGSPTGDAAAMEARAIDSETVAGLSAICARLRATPFMVASAALALVLGRWTGRDDVVVGVPVAGRTQSAFDRTVGLFLNTLPLRIAVSGAESVSDLIARAREAALGAFAHQDLPFERLVEELAPERSAAHHPFFDVMLNFVNTPNAVVELDALDISRVEIAPADAKYPLTLYIIPRDGRLELRAVYRRGLFAPERVAALLEEFSLALDQFVASPDARVDDVTLVTGTARRLLPNLSARIEPAAHETAAAQFARVCAAAPDALAVDDRGSRWTYRALSQAAGAVQRHLDASGVPAGARVAIVGTASSRFVAALLGVLGSGRVAVPIDGFASPERRDLMTSAAAVHCTLSIDERFQLDEGGGPLAPASGNDEAYVYFTSGTAGVPKAVLGSHRGLAHFLAWEREVTGVSAADRVAQVTSPSFDVFLRETLLPLTSGASLHIPSPACGAASESMCGWLARNAITIVHAVPAVAQYWLAGAPGTASLPALRCTLFAGEPLTGSLANRWRAAAPSSRVINLYGPTETTLAKCWYEVPAEPSAAGILPVGRAIHGAQVVVMRGDHLCGIGEAGEIVIRTPYRSHGYLNAADAATRFAVNPLADDPADIVYRTGDRGRLRPDGNIAISGRFDDAIKIRGVAVDVAEVEAVLALHPDVAAAGVAAHVSDDGATLLACVVARGTVSADGLRTFVERRLPAAARPQRIAFVNEIPRTAHGKIDRRAVMQLAESSPLEEQHDEPPATPTERALADIWRTVLGCNGVTRHTDFFEAGGHSLLTARLVARVRPAFGVDLPMRAVFDAPTLAALSAAIDTLRTAPGMQSTPEIPRVDRARFRSAARTATGGPAT